MGFNVRGAKARAPVRGRMRFSGKALTYTDKDQTYKFRTLVLIPSKGTSGAIILGLFAAFVPFLFVVF
jgi:hypothetical protein